MRLQANGSCKFIVSQAGDLIASGALNIGKGSAVSVSPNRFRSGTKTHGSERTA